MAPSKSQDHSTQVTWQHIRVLALGIAPIFRIITRQRPVCSSNSNGVSPHRHILQTLGSISKACLPFVRPVWSGSSALPPPTAYLEQILGGGD